MSAALNSRHCRFLYNQEFTHEIRKVAFRRSFAPRLQRTSCYGGVEADNGEDAPDDGGGSEDTALQAGGELPNRAARCDALEMMQLFRLKS